MSPTIKVTPCTGHKQPRLEQSKKVREKEGGDLSEKLLQRGREGTEVKFLCLAHNTRQDRNC